MLNKKNSNGDKYLIDNHKLIYHPREVARWLNANNNWRRLKKIIPIYIEISPTSACNHRCVFCALDYTDHEGSSLDTAIMKKRFIEMASMGAKSVMFAGEGEPLLHKGINVMVADARRAGLDVSLTTNGVLVNSNFIKSSFNKISWIKISINAARQKTYQRIHKCNKEDFSKVLGNLHKAVKYKREHRVPCVLGVQMILLPENIQEVYELAKIAKDTGADYFVLKPYSQHKKSLHKQNQKYNRQHLAMIERKCCALSNHHFSVIFRYRAIESIQENMRSYKHCLS